MRILFSMDGTDRRRTFGVRLFRLCSMILRVTALITSPTSHLEWFAKVNWERKRRKAVFFLAIAPEAAWALPCTGTWLEKPVCIASPGRCLKRLATNEARH